MDKAVKWAEEAVRVRGCPEKLSAFARKYLYGAGVPTVAELLDLEQLTRLLYVWRFMGDRHDVFVFTFVPCSRAKVLVAFKFTHNTSTVERIRYPRGKCPWLDYTSQRLKVKDDMDPRPAAPALL